MCYFGDGAASEGATHEAMNLAGVHKLPVVFLCENNGYAISVPLAQQMPITSLAAARCRRMALQGPPSMDATQKPCTTRP